jgi:hypothetical protein
MSKENRPRGEEHHMYGKTHTDEAKKRIGASSSGRTHSDESKQKITKGISGNKNGNYGRSFTEEHKYKISKSKIGSVPANKGKKETVVQCPYCGKEGGHNAMSRWHFKNCRYINKNK